MQVRRCRAPGRRPRFFHSWYMRLLVDGALECTRCGAVKRERRPRHRKAR